MQKHVNLVDLVKSFPATMNWQNLVSILAKFGFDTAENEPFKVARSPCTDPPGVKLCSNKSSDC